VGSVGGPRKTRGKIAGTTALHLGIGILTATIRPTAVDNADAVAGTPHLLRTKTISIRL
jgi:hypothetical protein